MKKASSLSIPLASLKFPPVVSISYSPSRAKDWDDIVTAHTDEPFVRTWTMLGKKVGKHNLGLADTHKSKSKVKGSGNVGSIKVSLSFINDYVNIISKLNDRRYVLLHVEIFLWLVLRLARSTCGICNLEYSEKHTLWAHVHLK